MGILASQLNRFKQVSKSNELDATTNIFPGMIERNSGFYSEVAEKLNAYISIHLRWILH